MKKYIVLILVLFLPLAQGQSDIPNCGASYIGPVKDFSGIICKFELKKGMFAQVKLERWYAKEKNSDSDEESGWKPIDAYFSYENNDLITEEKSGGIVNVEHDIIAYVENRPMTNVDPSEIGLCRFILGKENGECFHVAVEIEEEPTYICSDSDGGGNYEEKGTVTQTASEWYTFEPISDRCLSKYDLREYYCEFDKFTWYKLAWLDRNCNSIYEAEYGGYCADGACVIRTKSEDDAYKKLIIEAKEIYEKNKNSDLEEIRKIKGSWGYSLWGGQYYEEQIAELEANIERYEKEIHNLNPGAIFDLGSQEWIYDGD